MDESSDKGVRDDEGVSEETTSANAQAKVQKERQKEEEFLRVCYLGDLKEIEVLAAQVGTFRVQETRDKKQRRGLHLAASNGKTEVVRTLIARYACDADAEDEDGRVPLHFAASQGQTETVNCLCTFGKAWVDSSDNQDDTPLHLAARAGHTATCVELVDQGASGHGRNGRGLTPVGEAVVGGHAETVLALGDQNPVCLQDRPKGFSLLHLACGQSKPEVVSYLLTKVPALLDDTHNPQRLSPLHSCVIARSKQCMDLLIQAGCKCTPDMLKQASGMTEEDLEEMGKITGIPDDSEEGERIESKASANERLENVQTGGEKKTSEILQEATKESGLYEEGKKPLSAEVWEACKRQLILCSISLVCTFILMWFFKNNSHFNSIANSNFNHGDEL